MTALVVVLRPGLLASLQDLGRWGHQAAGVPVGGAMDWWSHRLANGLVGNPPELATIEVTLGGFEATVSGPSLMAVAGASLDVLVDGTRLATPAAFRMAAGSRLALGRPRHGARAYVAVRGGFDVPSVLGSRSTSLRAGFGGFHGRALRARDEVPLGLPAGGSLPAHRVGLEPAAWLPLEGEVTVLRVLPSDVPEHAPLARHLSQYEWQVTAAADRMGYRLGGPPPGTPIPDVLTTPTAIGSIQMPPSGEPILLMTDRQTTGGYVQPAVVISADLPVAGQLAPGNRVRFEPCTHEAAHRAMLARIAELDRLTPSRP